MSLKLQLYAGVFVADDIIGGATENAEAIFGISEDQEYLICEIPVDTFGNKSISITGDALASLKDLASSVPEGGYLYLVGKFNASTGECGLVRDTTGYIYFEGTT